MAGWFVGAAFFLAASIGLHFASGTRSFAQAARGQYHRLRGVLRATTEDRYLHGAVRIFRVVATLFFVASLACLVLGFASL